jgi:hypothetical protein
VVTVRGFLLEIALLLVKEGETNGDALFSRLKGILPSRRRQKSPVRDRAFQESEEASGSVADVHLRATAAELNF